LAGAAGGLKANPRWRVRRGLVEGREMRGMCAVLAPMGHGSGARKWKTSPVSYFVYAYRLPWSRT
jgi:hypothetical protein